MMKDVRDSVALFGEFLVYEAKRESASEIQVVLAWDGHTPIGFFDVVGNLVFRVMDVRAQPGPDGFGQSPYSTSMISRRISGPNHRSLS